jgi:serine phosphatase RsbU (regulator of sigma subunit)
METLRIDFGDICSIFIDIANLRLSYASAGHPPSFLWRESKKEMYRFQLGGTILGPFPNPVYENEVLDISKDDRLVLHTDGIVETMNKNGELFGDVRMKAFIEAHTADSAERTSDQFIEHLLKWSGKSRDSSFEDDLTLIIIDIDTGPRAPTFFACQPMASES